MPLLSIKIIIFSLVQALTEFLPVSSSGHLILLHQIIGDNILNNITFDVALHGGSLLALIIIFFKDIKKITTNSVRCLLDKKNFIKSKDLGFIILIAIIPAGITGYFFEDYIGYIFRSPFMVAIFLILGSIFFVFAQAYSKNRRNINDIGPLDALFVGLMQCLALIPGVSRSGITISSSMMLNISKIDAAKFSFLLAIPIIFGAFIKKIFDVLQSNYDFSILIIGFVFSFIFSVVAIKILLKLLSSKYGLYPFVIYRILLAVAIFIFFV